MPSTPTPWRRRLAAALALAHLLQLLPAGPALGQVSGSPQAPSGQRPLIDAAGNGVPVVHIAPPNASGVSRNGYERFNVPQQGLVLNNSPDAVLTRQAGWISRNLQLGRVPARIILNEVLGREPTQLLGTLEVAGQRADVVIANPNGISCDGCGFLNTAGRATLLGGRAQLDAQGGLASLEALASVRIGPRGLDATHQQQLDLVARGLVIEGEVWAQDLRAVIGANRVLYADLRGPLQQLPTGSEGAPVRFAVDVRELGGMYARQIYLVATERGLGVNSTGRLAALEGHLQLSSAGDLRVRDAYAQQDLSLAAQGRLDTTGTVSAGRDLHLAAGTLLSNRGDIEADGRLHLTTPHLHNAGTLAQYASGAALAITAAESIVNEGTVHASGDLRLSTARLRGADGTLQAQGRLAIRADDVQLAQHTLAATGAIDIEAASVALTDSRAAARETLRIASRGKADLTGSRAAAGQALVLKGDGIVTDRAQLSAPQLQLDAGDGALSNRGGQLQASGSDDATLSLAASGIDNSGGQLLSQHRLLLDAGGGALDNSAGVVAGARTLLQGVASLTNREGTLYVDSDLHLRGPLDNTGGLIDSSAALTLEAAGQALANQGGAIVTARGLQLVAGTLDNRDGLLATAGDATLAAAALDNRGGVLRANGTLALEAGHTDNHGGVIAGLHSLALSGGDLDNDAGVIEAGAGGLRIKLAGTLTNTRSGNERGIATLGDLTLEAGRIDNQGGYAGAGGRLDLSADAIDNRRGRLAALQGLTLDAAGRLDNREGLIASAAGLTMAADTLDNRVGAVFAAGDLVLAAARIDNRHTRSENAERGLLAGGDLRLGTVRLDNQDGLVAALGHADLKASTALGNEAGQISGTSVAIDTAHLANTGGRVDAIVQLDVRAASFSADGVLASAGGLGLHTQGDYTHTGTLSAGGDLAVSTTGHYVNAGTLSAQGDLHLAAQRLTNQEQARIVGRNTTIEVAEDVANAGLINATAGTTRIQAASLANTGRIYGDSVLLQAAVRNAANPRGQGAVIAAREGLLRIDGSLHNSGGSQVLGLGDMEFLGEVTNLGATINAGGNIRFTKALRNLNANLRTEMRTTVAPSSGLFITPVGTTDAFAVAQLRWRDSEGGRWALPSERYPFEAFGSEPMPRVLDMQCGSDPGDCSLVLRYPPDDPAWQRFEVAPPPPPPALPAGRAHCDGPSAGDGGPPVRDDAGACGAYWAAVDQHHYESTLAYQRLQKAFDVFDADLDRRSIVDWFEFQATERTLETTVITSSQPGQVLAGGSMQVNGGLNEDSLITAGGQITGVDVQNRATDGQQRSTDHGQIRFTKRIWHGGIDADHEREFGPWQPASGGTRATTFKLDTLTQRGNAQVAAPAPQPNPPAAAADAVQVVQGLDAAPLPPADHVPADLAGALPASLIAAPLRAGQDQVVQALRTSFAALAASQPLPALAQAQVRADALPTRAAPLKGAGHVTVAYDGPVQAPAHQLFTVHGAPQAGYLVETDPAYTGWREFISSAAMMAALAMDPERNLKRYGDGFAEQRLIDQQVIALTGQRYLADYSSTEAEYAALMAAGVAFARAYQLTPGVALSAEQMALLTTDIVWLEARDVTLPDGSTVQALVPRVYLRRPAAGDVRPTGALIAASDIHLREPDGEIVNTGTLLAHGAGNDDGRGHLVLEAKDIRNDGALYGHAIATDAQRDLLLAGGTVMGLGEDSVVRLHAGRDIVLRTTTQTTLETLSGPNGATTTLSVNVDRVATVQAGRADFVAGRHIQLQGARITTDDALGMQAGGDIAIEGVRESYATYVPVGGEAFDRTGYYKANRSTHVGSVIDAGGDASFKAGGDFFLTGSVLRAGGDLGIDAEAVRVRGEVDTQTIETQGIGRHGYHQAFTSGQSLAEAALLAGGNLDITARQDLSLLGARLSAETGDATLDAGGKLTVGTLALTQERETAHRNENARRFSYSASQGATYERSTYAAGSSVSGNNVTLRAGTGGQGLGDLLIEGSMVVAQHDLTASATGDVTLRAATDTFESNSSHRAHKSGAGAMGGASWGTYQSKENSTETRQSASASTFGSLEGDVRITAGGTYRQEGSDVLALVGDIQVEAERIEVVEARESARSERHTETRQSGVTVSVSNPALEAAQGVGRMAQAARNTSDARMQALAAAAAALTVANAAGDVMANPDQLGGVSLNLSLGSSKSSSDSLQWSDTAATSSLRAGGRVSLKASGAGDDSDIVLQGVQLTAGGDVTLDAQDDLLMLGARNASGQHSQNQSSGASVGISLGGGSDGVGFAITGSAQRARGHADGSEVSWTHSNVHAGGTLTIKTGGDTVMQGATAGGHRVVTDIEGDLLVESLQDTSTYDSQQRSVGAAGSVGVGTRGSSGSASASGSKVHSQYASVTQQSGIRAGDGGFDVQVAGMTTLIGGAITSTDKAVDEGRNAFETQHLVMQDIENHAEYTASGYAVSVGSKGSSAGVGRDSGSASSTTRSAISGIAGDASQRTGDAETGIKPIFDANKTPREIDAQVAITSEFGQQASKAWGTYATSQYLDALKNGDSEAQACWAPDGSCRAGGHALIGGLTGGVAGAAGAGASSLVAPQFQQVLVSAGVPSGAATLLTEVGVSAAAAGVGGVQGGAAALNEAGNNFAAAAGAIMQAVLQGGGAAARACTSSPSCLATVGTFGAAAVDSIRRLAESAPAPSGAPGYEPGAPRGGGPTEFPTLDRAEPSISISPPHAPLAASPHSGGRQIAVDSNTSTVSPSQATAGQAPLMLNEARPLENAAPEVLNEIQRLINSSRQPGRASDPAGNEIGRIVIDSRGNAMIEPAGGRTVPAGKDGVDTHTLYPNGSNYQRLNPQGHANNPSPHAHGHAPGTGPGMKGQGPSLDVNGNVVPWNSPAAHWPIH